MQERAFTKERSPERYQIELGLEVAVAFMKNVKKTSLRIIGYVSLAFLLIAAALALTIYLTLVSLNDDSSWVASQRRDVLEDVEAPGVYQYHERTNFLVLGSDKAGGVERTDVMIVVSVDEKRANAALISIPRDSKVTVKGRTEKINAVFPNHGIITTMQVVQDLLNIPIHYYIKMDFEGFEKIIDTLGGVIIDVEMPMVYDDYSQNLHIRLMPGRQRLNGKESLHYVRYRGDGFGDVTATNSGYVGRVARQQKFIEALVNEASRPSNLGKLPALTTQLKDAVRTNLTPAEMLKWATLAQSSRGFQIKSFVAPGRPETIGDASYWVIDEKQLAEIVNEYFTVGRYGFSVGIMNGSGNLDAARKFAEELREKGFKVSGVSEVKDYQYQYTVIQAREEFADAIEWLKVNLGLGDKEWIKADSPLGDVTILLGRDMINR